VGRDGAALVRRIEKLGTKLNPGTSIANEGWGRVIDDVLRSPKQPNQKGKRFLQMTPLVPSTAIYSMAARLKGNPWNPGGLIESCISLGESSEADANAAWKALFLALSVDEEKDDAWAVFLEREFSAWNDERVSWAFAGNVQYDDWMRDWPRDCVAFPAKRFARDISYVVKAKPYLTRRQWVSVLESILRVGVGAHVLWTSRVNYELYALAEGVLKGGSVPSTAEIALSLSAEDGFWSYGQLVGSHIKKLVRGYMYGRVGLNLLLYRCQELDELNSLVTKRPFRNLESIREFLEALSQSRSAFNAELFLQNLNEAVEADPRKLAIKQGIGKNMEEFLRHSLGQRETQERGLESYDQGYLLTRRSAYARAPWVLAAGPVTVLALAHACSCDGTGTRTVEDLSKHFAEYGVKIGRDEVAGSPLGASLRTLGLVLDSPDAEGGMVLLDPFPANAGATGSTG
jgi:hypothetical protein